ncbi:hypothetical protein [Citrobacter koseri]|uniref:hypothetical protein n=1 Tax=Citrobacter koseri TaxID=545 RepID=UPI000D96965C|nr:hypothetical protein [Citrobacter koseri]SQB09206.1 Uncharacterised protein [Citrobacter koseri]STB47769.1 Uncharacterised protein [Citrobacter koseri]
MTTITKEQAKDLRNAFECWQQDYDPTEDKEQYEMFGLGVVAMDVLLASLDAGSDSHPAHGPLSNDRLHRISDILRKAAAQSAGGNIGYAMSDAVRAIDELLAGRKAEPVAFINGAWTLVYYRPPKEAGLKIGDKLYAAQPAPVVMRRYIFEKWWESQNGTPLDGWDSLRTTDGYCDDGIDGQFDAWNACRAAMLQGGINRENYPVI